MLNIITDENKIDEILERGVEKIYPNKKALKKKLMAGKRIKLYCGFDPSAAALHIGNAIQLNKLSQFQELGHDVIFLIGDFTGMIGDPTDKTSARQQMTREQVEENSKNFQQQASAYLEFEGENPAQILYNSEWSDKMTFKDLIEITANFTVQQMIQRDMFQKRLKDEKPIYLHEFLYPVAQGYDSVAMDVDLEIGGNDQMFNMMAGRTLMQAIKKKEKFVMTNKLIADEAGNKMGKSEGNAVFLDVNSKDMYGVIMSWPDEVIASGFELCTKISFKEVKQIRKDLKSKKNNPRDYKMRLAFEITKLVHGEEKARLAQENFIRTIQNKEAPEEVIPSQAPPEKFLRELIVEEGLASSNNDAKRKISQGGIKIDNEVITDINYEIGESDNGKILKVGKHDFRKILLG